MLRLWAGTNEGQLAAKSCVETNMGSTVKAAKHRGCVLMGKKVFTVRRKIEDAFGCMLQVASCKLPSACLPTAVHVIASPPIGLEGTP